ncbi:hypothetical protein VNO77_00116 [Canavalia gladiata]|uniref:Uncharacterized protein n=1 Tax=Canavalia gladiata TaxID=3824 RepID=A0AAN9MU13_CANGL
MSLSLRFVKAISSCWFSLSSSPSLSLSSVPKFVTLEHRKSRRKRWKRERGRSRRTKSKWFQLLSVEAASSSLSCRETDMKKRAER